MWPVCHLHLCHSPADVACLPPASVPAASAAVAAAAAFGAEVGPTVVVVS